MALKDYPFPRLSTKVLGLITIFSLAALLGISASLLSNDVTSLWWHLGTTVAAATLLGLARTLPDRLRLLYRLLILLCAAGLSSLVFYKSYQLLGNFEGQHQINLFFTNPNFLAAMIAVAGTVSLVLSHSIRVGFLAVPLSVALLLIGSRTALVAYLIALLGWGFLFQRGAWRRKVRFSLALTAILGSGYLCLYLWSSTQPRASGKNLLTYSDVLEHPAWTTRHAAEITLNASISPGPIPGGNTYHIRGRSNPNSLYPNAVLIQNTEPSEQDQYYTASVYLRAESPQRVHLYSNITSVICHVTNVWKRCQTPVSPGNGKTRIGLHLNTLEPGDTLDLYVWGAQVEVGHTPSDPEHTSEHPFVKLVENISGNLKFQNWWDDKNVISRKDTYRSAWHIFLTYPLSGAGLGRFYNETQNLVGSEIQDRHAHNLLLHLLAETGILGLLSWAIPFFGVLALYWKKHWRQLLPLATCIFILNMTDFTYYHSSTYYFYWLTLGLIISENNAPATM